MLALLALLTLPHAQADEGMWLPEQLPALAGELEQMGLTLPASQLADPQGDPLGAIVSLGGCSAAFVSPDGLIATNHHCVLGYLQYNSDAEHDRAHEGYLAADKAAELWAGPSARLYVVESIEDVTREVLDGVHRRTSDLKRYERIQRNRKELVATCEAQPNRSCQVVSYYGGQTWRLVTRRELRDLRVVYAPAESLGQFGGEVDNWMWPRHGEDFSLLRAYVAPDGSTADHDEANVPYQPPHHLDIDPTGAQDGEFVMVAGYPGRTYRYRSADALRFMGEVGYPYKIDLYGRMVQALREVSAQDPEGAARLGAPIDWIGNSQKYAEGMRDALRHGSLMDTKQAEWDALSTWAHDNHVGGAELDELGAIEADARAYWKADLLVSWLGGSSDMLQSAERAWRWSGERLKPDLERDAGYQDRDLPRIRASFERMDKTLWVPADRALLGIVLHELDTLPADGRVPPVDEWIAANGGVDAALERLFDAPPLAAPEARLALLDQDRESLGASDDPMVQLAIAIEEWQAGRRVAQRTASGAHLRLEPAIMQAMVESRGGRVYPDANSTLRITVGHVQGCDPRDGLRYLPQTTLHGILEKAGPAPFDMPQRVLDRIPDAPKSRWADPDLGDVPLDFLTTLDTTGGNSGSATLNGQGKLVGLVFDGNYEAISADWVFDPALTRSIHVDVRAMLWLLEEVEHADWILDELGVGAE